MAPFFGFYLRHQVTPFIILFIERDGSTYLTNLLMSHPDISAVFERFAVMKQKGEGAEAQLRWARTFLTPPIVARVGARGFKTKLVDILNPDEFTRLLREKECRVVQMLRRNHVKAVVSRINARRLYELAGTWNLYNEKDRLPPMNIDPSEFDTYLREREDAECELNEFVGNLDLPTMRIYYEDLLVNRDQVLDEVFSFLEVPPHVVHTKTMKNTSDDLRDVILNFEELQSFYLGTIYESMFEEVLLKSQ